MFQRAVRDLERAGDVCGLLVAVREVSELCREEKDCRQRRAERVPLAARTLFRRAAEAEREQDRQQLKNIAWGHVNLQQKARHAKLLRCKVARVDGPLPRAKSCMWSLG